MNTYLLTPGNQPKHQIEFLLINSWKFHVGRAKIYDIKTSNLADYISVRLCLFWYILFSGPDAFKSSFSNPLSYTNVNRRWAVCTFLTLKMLLSQHAGFTTLT